MNQKLPFLVFSSIPIKKMNESQNNSNKNNNSSADQSKLKTTKGTISTIIHDLDADAATNTPVESDNQKLNKHHHHQQQPTKKRTKKIPRKQQRMKSKGIIFHNGKIAIDSHLIKRTLECIDISI
jgi:hypothetical protein